MKQNLPYGIYSNDINERHEKCGSKYQTCEPRGMLFIEESALPFRIPYERYPSLDPVTIKFSLIFWNGRVCELHVR